MVWWSHAVGVRVRRAGMHALYLWWSKGHKESEVSAATPSSTQAGHAPPACCATSIAPALLLPAVRQISFLIAAV